MHQIINYPLISIIIPLYNKQDCIIKTIESITTQDFNDYEIVVVDDGSTDKSVAIVKDLNNEKIKIFQKENGGPASARNYGVEHATGKWGLFLDADDTLEPGSLKLFEDLVQKEPDCEFFCCNHYVQANNIKTLFSSKFKEGYVRNNFFAYQTKRIRPRAGAALFSMSLLRKYPYNEQFRRYEDADCVFNIMRNTKAYTCPIPILTYNRNNAEASRPRKDIKEDYIGSLSYEGKGCWEQLTLYNLYLQGCRAYPDDMKRLYDPKKMYNNKVKICKKIITLLTLVGYIK